MHTNSALKALHSRLCTQSSALKILHSRHFTQDSVLRTQHSKLSTQGSALKALHSRLCTQGSTLKAHPLEAPHPRKGVGVAERLLFEEHVHLGTELVHPSRCRGQHTCECRERGTHVTRGTLKIMLFVWSTAKHCRYVLCLRYFFSMS